MLTVGSLFSGIGGLELGLERAGMVTRWQVESDPYARSILHKHWPRVARFSDVRNVGRRGPVCQLERVDLIAGGFPCQDLSIAGRGGGLAGSRSGLWREFARIIAELRPRFALIENVPALLRRGLAEVLQDLSARGYDAIWDCLPAEAFGASHTRDRVFLVAWETSDPVGHALRFGPKWNQWGGWNVRKAISQHPEPLEHGPIDGWTARPALARMGNGLPSDVDRTRCLGNAAIPIIGEHVGRCILEALER